MNKNKIIFYLFWLALLALGPITVLLDTPFSLVLKNRVILANFVQRILGLAAFTMLFVQILLGSFMQKWTERFGGWVLNFHIFEGILVYILIFLHPVFFMLFNRFAGHGLDPLGTFLDVCLLCSKTIDYYYSLGRISFWLVTTAVFAGLFRLSTPFMRLHWRRFHVVNYVAFLLIGIHGLSLGTDFRSFPFVAFAIPAYAIVLGVTLPKVYGWIKTFKE